MEIAARGRQDQIAIAVDEFRKNANTVFKAPLFPHIVGGHDATRADIRRGHGDMNIGVVGIRPQCGRGREHHENSRGKTTGGCGPGEVRPQCL